MLWQGGEQPQAPWKPGRAPSAEPRCPRVRRPHATATRPTRIAGPALGRAGDKHRRRSCSSRDRGSRGIHAHQQVGVHLGGGGNFWWVTASPAAPGLGTSWRVQRCSWVRSRLRFPAPQPPRASPSQQLLAITPRSEPPGHHTPAPITSNQHFHPVPGLHGPAGPPDWTREPWCRICPITPQLSRPREQGSVTMPAKVTGGSCQPTAAARALSQQVWGRKAGKAISVPAEEQRFPRGVGKAALPHLHIPVLGIAPFSAALPTLLPAPKIWGPQLRSASRNSSRTIGCSRSFTPGSGDVRQQRAGQGAPGLEASEALAAPVLACTATRSCNSWPRPCDKEQGKRNWS